MRDRLKRLRKAATQALDAAKTGPKDALKNVTEGMLRKATASGVPQEVASAGSAAAASLWARVSPDDPLARARLAEALVRDGRAADALDTITPPDDDGSEATLLTLAWLARAEILCDRQEEAVARIERAVALMKNESSPLNSQVRGALASAALDASRPDLARRVIADEEKDPLALVARARLALIRGRGEDADEILRRACTDALEEATAWRAVSLALAGQPRQALDLIDSLRGRGPEAPWIDVTLGWLQLVEGHAEAAATIHRSLERKPRLAAASYLAGIVAEREGDLELAQSAFHEAGQKAPTWTEPWLGVLRVAMNRGDYTEAQEAADRTGDSSENQLLTGLALGLSGDVAGAEALWSASTGNKGDREALREIATLRCALAWRLTLEGKTEAASEAWKRVGSKASQAGSSRITLARWAIDSARRCIESTQPAYYLVESALSAASALRPESEDLVVSHCSASFLARGPAAARSSLEAALARGAADERIVGLLGLIDAATKGSPAPTNLTQSSAATEAARLAREGDAEACLEALTRAESEAKNPALKAVSKGAKALLNLSNFGSLLQRGELEKAAEVLNRALEHLPAGLQRDQLLHDLAAVCTLAAFRSDLEQASQGAPPSQQTLIWWQEALGYWCSLGSASAYWADLARKVMEYDDPRLSPRDVDSLRASLPLVACELVDRSAAEAATSGHYRRTRSFLALIIGAPFDEETKRKGLRRALAPLSQRAHEIADEAKKAAIDGPVEELLDAYLSTKTKITDFNGELSQAAPATIEPVIDARDELALCLVSFFENLHDRARNGQKALEALDQAAELAASETLRAELEGKLARMRQPR